VIVGIGSSNPRDFLDVTFDVGSALALEGPS